MAGLRTKKRNSPSRNAKARRRRVVGLVLRALRRLDQAEKSLDILVNFLGR
jgi:hypothetical protein